MEKAIQKLKEERAPIVNNLMELETFIEKGEETVISIVGERQYKLLKVQLDIMYNYVAVLDLRIEDLTNKSTDRGDA